MPAPIRNGLEKHMRITAHSEVDARKASLSKLLPPGNYLGRILDAIEKASKAGNNMIELTVLIAGRDGMEREFKDWLVANDKGALKLRHAAETCGLLDKYDSGEIEDRDFVGKTVRVKIVVEKRRSFPDQNRIEDYIAV